MHSLSALLLLAFVGSSAAAATCSVEGPIGDEILTTVSGSSFPITIGRCPVYLFYSCDNPSAWAAYLNHDKVLYFTCDSQTTTMGIGDMDNKCGTTITYGGDGKITIDYDEPIGMMCGLCRSTGEQDAADTVQC